MSEFESFEDDIDDITLIQVAENVIHTEAQLNIRSSDDDTGDFGNFDIKLLTASFELDNITDEEKTEIEQESKPQCSSSERETNDGLDSPIDVKDSSRFGGQTSDVDFTAIQREFESKNTRKNTTWALKMGTAHWSYGPLVLQPIGPTTHWSYDSLVLWPISHIVLT